MIGCRGPDRNKLDAMNASPCPDVEVYDGTVTVTSSQSAQHSNVAHKKKVEFVSDRRLTI